MVADKPSGQRIPGYCALCVSRCGSIAVVENGRFVALEPDPSHPTGKALCAKGRAAPELVYHSERLLYPLKRTRPKGDPDPGWQRISWDEALDLTAARLRTIAQEHGPESVVFSVASPSTSASDDSVIWIQRLMNAFGSPNLCAAMELCGWGRFLATQYTFGAAVPGAYYAWSGVEMQTNATQIARAIAQLYVLTGSFDGPGGNVLFPAVPGGNVVGAALLPAEQRARTLGLLERPLGPSRWQFVTTDELYRAILEQRPYPVRGLVGFGANLLLAHADGRRGRGALAALDFYVHADLFMNPTAELADIVLPVTSAFEREALKIGFEVSAEAQSLVQLRPRVVEPRGEARSDTEIVFDLACRLGLGVHFWDGDIEAAYRSQLHPSGVSLVTLRENPSGVRVPLQTRYRKFAEQKDGIPRGFATPTRKIEVYSQTLLEHGYPPLPEYEEPRMGPSSRPDLVERFPLILTCAKHTLFCESQHRALPRLRRQALDPEVELHPSAASERGIGPGDWVHIETPGGSVRARAKMNDTLEPHVVCGQHGWWQACSDLGMPGYDPFGPEGANLNLIIGNEAIDPVSGSVPHRAYLCQIRRAD
jgi:anaerobic selenocysteine-containing dehydrogenase